MPKLTPRMLLSLKQQHPRLQVLWHVLIGIVLWESPVHLTQLGIYEVRDISRLRAWCQEHSISFYNNNM